MTRHWPAASSLSARTTPVPEPRDALAPGQIEKRLALISYSSALQERPRDLLIEAVFEDLEVAHEQNARLHLCHLSLPRSVDLVQWYKTAGPRCHLGDLSALPDIHRG